MDLHSYKLLFTSISLFAIVFSCIVSFINCARTKRTLAFTSGNSFGYLAAVAIPIELPNRNLYVAFNLETNYGLPPNDTHYNLIEKWNLSGMFSDVGNNVTRIDGGRKRRSLYNRSSFYQCVSGYFELFGMNGRECLLRTICEVAESKLYISNGVLGSILHILFMYVFRKNMFGLLPQLMKMYHHRFMKLKNLAIMTNATNIRMLVQKDF